MRKFYYVLLLVLVCIFFFKTDSFAYDSSPYKIHEDSDGVYVIEVKKVKNTEIKRNKFLNNKFMDKFLKKGYFIPFVVDELETNNEIYDLLNPKFVVNAGFFDPKNQKTISYVVMDGNLVVNPEDNENLMNNTTLEPYFDKILNRSEFRIMESDEGRIVFDITPHSDVVPSGYKIKHSIQAGPMLVPDLRLDEEFFILKRDGKIISESASSLHKYARTAIGIKDNKVYIFIITNKSPMTLEEVSELALKWGMQKAMAFDGGGSTSFDSKELHIISEQDNQARKLKSFLMFK